MKKTGKGNLSIFVTMVFFVFVGVYNASGETVNILAPYAGWVTNVYETEFKAGTNTLPLKLKDTGFLSGLYLQSINPALYQWNAFLYYSPDVTYSTLWGGHFIVDFYPIGDIFGKYLIGAGIEVIRIDMDAGNNIKVATGPSSTATLEGFTLENTLLIPYGRVGKYFVFGAGPARISFLPWLGATYESVKGKVKFEAQFAPPPIPKTKVDESFDDSDWYATAGLNVKLTLFRFIDLEAKYQATFDEEVYHPSYSIIGNLFVSRNWGLSYRYKYMETSGGSDEYHLFGLAYVF